MSDNVKYIGQDEYEKEVLKSGNVMVDFYSTDCPPCEALSPKFELFAKNYSDKIKFIKIFRQENRELSEKLQVKSSPTVLFYKDGRETAPRLNGAIKKKELKETILNSYDLADRIPVDEREVTECDVAIIGAGPAGLSAGLYASRAKLNTIIIDKAQPGGYVNVTHSVANYPGTKDEIKGFML